MQELIICFFLFFCNYAFDPNHIIGLGRLSLSKLTHGFHVYSNVEMRLFEMLGDGVVLGDFKMRLCHTHWICRENDNWSAKTIIRMS